jgi:hypothetical protein
MITLDGHLRLHLLEAADLRHVGGPFHTMSPYVHVHIGKI